MNVCADVRPSMNENVRNTWCRSSFVIHVPVWRIVPFVDSIGGETKNRNCEWHTQLSGVQWQRIRAQVFGDESCWYDRLSWVLALPTTSEDDIPSAIPSPNSCCANFSIFSVPSQLYRRKIARGDKTRYRVHAREQAAQYIAPSTWDAQRAENRWQNSSSQWLFSLPLTGICPSGLLLPSTRNSRGFVPLFLTQSGHLALELVRISEGREWVTKCFGEHCWWHRGRTGEDWNFQFCCSWDRGFLNF